MFVKFILHQQVVAERVHVRVLHRPDQTAAELHVLRQRLHACRPRRRRRGHHRKVHAAGPAHLHDRKVRAHDPNFGPKGFQVRSFVLILCKFF